MGCCPEGCGKAFLVTLNILVLLLGVLCLGGGLFLKFGSSITGPLIDPLLSSLSSQTGVSASSGSTSGFGSTLDVAAYLLIGLGAFMLVVGVIGCAGACCSVTVLLAIYVSAVLLVFIAMIVWLGLWLGKTVDDKIFPAMVVNVKTKYAGPTAFNAESLMLNLLMIQLKCCGIESYREFKEATGWDRNITINGIQFQQEIPVTCCQVTGQFPSITPIDEQCTLYPSSLNANIDTNCHKAVQDQIDLYKAAVFGTYAGVLALELLCAAVAICLIVLKKKKDGKVHPDGESQSSKNVHKNQVAPQADSAKY